MYIVKWMLFPVFNFSFLRNLIRILLLSTPVISRECLYGLSRTTSLLCKEKQTKNMTCMRSIFVSAPCMEQKMETEPIELFLSFFLSSSTAFHSVPCKYNKIRFAESGRKHTRSLLMSSVFFPSIKKNAKFILLTLH